MQLMFLLLLLFLDSFSAGFSNAPKVLGKKAIKKKSNNTSDAAVYFNINMLHALRFVGMSSELNPLTYTVIAIL